MKSDKIRFRNFDSPIGPMIAGASSIGVCFLEWHDRGGIDRILERVEKRYKLSAEEGTNSCLDYMESELAQYFDGRLQNFSVPLQIEGTAFEKSTWQQLVKIPYGKTCSYGDIARRLKRPGASRAVGRANGANYLSIIIPCHRVIESTGALRGYGGGLWRKKALLELESGIPEALSLFPADKTA